MKRGKREKSPPKNKCRVVSHLLSIGFTNRLAIYILMFLAAGLLGGFYLALLSISTGYMGALACYTAAFAPIGTAASIVLSRVVDKSRAENTGGNGDGIKFAMAMSDIVGCDPDNESKGESEGESPAI